MLPVLSPRGRPRRRHRGPPTRSRPAARRVLLCVPASLDSVVVGTYSCQPHSDLFGSSLIDTNLNSKAEVLRNHRRNEAVILIPYIASNFRDRPFGNKSNDDKPINTLAARGLDRESGDSRVTTALSMSTTHVHHALWLPNNCSSRRRRPSPPGGGPCSTPASRLSIEMVSRSSSQSRWSRGLHRQFTAAPRRHQSRVRPCPSG